MPLIGKCCCCGLRAGVMILGWIGLVLDIISLISAIFNYGNVDFEFSQNVDAETATKIAKSVMVSTISFSIIEIITNVLLLYGVNKKNRLLLLPWLTYNGLTLFLMIIVLLIGGLFCFFVEGLAPFGIALYIIGLPVAAFFIFCWLCVLSLYQVFAEEQSLNKRRRQEEIGFLPVAPHNPATKPPSYDQYDKV